MGRVKKRNNRRSQRRFRGDKRSPSDLYEDTAILLAWEAGDITEGQATKALGMHRVEAREAKLRIIYFGRAMAYELI